MATAGPRPSRVRRAVALLLLAACLVGRRAVAHPDAREEMSAIDADLAAGRVTARAYLR